MIDWDFSGTLSTIILLFYGKCYNLRQIFRNPDMRGFVEGDSAVGADGAGR
jgi:hypothetical protein